MSQRHLDAWVARSEELKASRANAVQEPMGIARSILQEFLMSLVERTRPLNASVLMAEATKWIEVAHSVPSPCFGMATRTLPPRPRG